MTCSCGSESRSERNSSSPSSSTSTSIGRGQGGPRHGPRPIDVDVLLLGDVEHASERLRLPHEQVLARRFVLIPLLELDFELRTPDGTRLADCLAKMPLDEGVRRAGGPLVVNRAA